jgi:uncharacterized membrane protein
MVLKGQIFLLDASLAFLTILLSFSTFLATAYLTAHNMEQSYTDFIRQKRLLDASEKLITVDFAGYSENTLKHHRLSMTKMSASIDDLKHSLLLDDYDIALSVSAGGLSLVVLGNATGGAVVKRVALCGEEICVLELRAE